MKATQYLIYGIIIALISCQPSERNSEQSQLKKSNELLIVGDIDTTKVISQLAIKASGSRLDLLNEKKRYLPNRIDTLDLTYYFGFCDCQRWVVSKTHDEAWKEHPNLDKLDPRGQIEFDLDKHGFYIEAASKELKIDWRTQINGTTVRLIGREYENKRLPKDGEFTVPDPPKGRVFRYYSYEILRPYQVWGPHKLTQVDEITGDSIKEPTILTVK